ncbi:type IV conjugative transfer system protein TraE [Aliidiomarina quisquiliarum]|uniref:type IV conjugative transfer system protein TraE n=1 Tax=Aliidiomarina quisquiliarum TaxID=2938947 RepID=UPI00208EFF77|nr:type IV conjugative transfer system protein TraE [Aliidiomarina quisquiliarum]MCO4319906.1 type IV conjugative transfer system protein TraE [Aliidiomarina quisquiliarum]
MTKSTRLKSKLSRGIDDYMQSRKILFASNVLLGVSCLVLAISTFSTRTEVIAIPPHMNDELRISGNRANEVYNLGWASFIAAQAGNINSNNADFVMGMMLDFMSPNLRSQTEDALRQEVQLLIGRGAEQRFSVDNAVYDPALNVAWVWGRRELRLPGVKPRVSRWTYEIRVVPNGANPRITYLNAYEGTPKRRARPELQEVNPFLTTEQELRMITIDTEAPVRQREIPSNAAPAVTIDLDVEDEVETNEGN